MFHTLFFDLDNTLYPADCGLWEAIGLRIESFLADVMQMQVEDVAAFRSYCRDNFGTTLQGLKNLYNIDEQHYLGYVHAVDLALYLTKDQRLASLLESLPQRKVILTNSDENHSRNVLRFLEIEHYFDLIIDVNKLDPFVKPELESYQKALELAEISSAEGCVFLDDYLPNVLGAQEAGYFGILVGEDHHTAFPNQIPDLFGLPAILERNVSKK